MIEIDIFIIKELIIYTLVIILLARSLILIGLAFSFVIVNIGLLFFFCFMDYFCAIIIIIYCGAILLLFIFLLTGFAVTNTMRISSYKEYIKGFSIKSRISRPTITFFLLMLLYVIINKENANSFIQLGDGMRCFYSFTSEGSTIFSIYTSYMPQDLDSTLSWCLCNKVSTLNTINTYMLNNIISVPTTSKFVFSTKYDTFDYFDIIAFNLFDQNIGITILLLTVLIVALFGCLELCRVKDKIN